MRKVKIGIFGLGRGASFYDNIILNDGEIVAVCDMSEDKLNEAKVHLGENLPVYKDFESFINHPGMESVFLCNYFHEHTPYAIKALEKGIHVLSECCSNATMADGVALVRAAEKSKAFYMLSENYPFMQFNLEMRRVYQSGALGKVLFAEGEYNHPLNPYDTKEIRGIRPYRNHWRNRLPRSYYITHSLAPLMYMTGSVPVRVSAMPVYLPFPKDSLLSAGPGDRAAIITTLNDDDSVFRVTGCAAFGAHENSYRICGEKGQIENVRGGGGKVMLRYNDWDVPEGEEAENYYSPEWHYDNKELIEKAGHGGGDFLVIREFFQCIRQNIKPVFDEYFSATMASVAILAHRSLSEKGVPYDIPDFRREEDRIKYENDTLSPFFGSKGETPTLNACSRIEPEPTPEELEMYETLLRQ